MAAAAGQSGRAEGRRAATGERLAARDAEPLHFSHPSVPSISRPPTLHTPCLPVSLGNLQLKASHPHGSMYPSNKKKKVWREEKGNRPRGPGGGRRVGGGRGPRRGGAAPSARSLPRALSAGAAPARGRVHARARSRSRPGRPRAAPGHLRLPHVRGAHPPRRRVVSSPAAGSPGPRASWSGPRPGICTARPGVPWTGCPVAGAQAAAAAEPGCACTCFLPFPASALRPSQPRSAAAAAGLLKFATCQEHLSGRASVPSEKSEWAFPGAVFPCCIPIHSVKSPRVRLLALRE